MGNKPHILSSALSCLAFQISTETVSQALNPKLASSCWTSISANGSISTPFNLELPPPQQEYNPINIDCTTRENPITTKPIGDVCRNVSQRYLCSSRLKAVTSKRTVLLRRVEPMIAPAKRHSGLKAVLIALSGRETRINSCRFKMLAMRRSTKRLKSTVKRYSVRTLRRLMKPRMIEMEASRTLGSRTWCRFALKR